MKAVSNRREFLALGGATTVAFLSRTRRSSAAPEGMTMDLVCGAIGVQASQREAIDLAAAHGFESVGVNAGEIASMSDSEIEDLLGYLEEKGLVFGAAGLPVQFREDEETFRSGVNDLGAVAAALEKAGVTRMSTWIMPNHATRTYIENFRLHASRLREVGRILGDHGIRFGLEYVGPKTSWTGERFPFIHTMAETSDLLSEIGLDNVGFVLDSWHWYTAQESEEDILSLSPQQVVAVDLNDAPVGIPVDQQMDLRRRLPMATGVIDVKTFLGALVTIGYGGPVRAEPFDATLRELPAEVAVQHTADAMKKAFALIR